MNNITARGRRFLAVVMLFAMLLSLLSAAATPVETFRVVRIRGRRVHLRDHIPPQLTHDHVIRHLGPGHLLFADRMAYGIGYDGKGQGVWLHVVDPNNGECGWVAAHYVEDSSGEAVDAMPVVEAAPTTPAPTAPATATTPAASSGHDAPPPDALAEEPTVVTKYRRRFGADTQFLANLASIAAVGIAILHLIVAAPPSPPSPLPAVHAAVVDPLPEPGDGLPDTTPNFIYGVSNGVPYRIPLKK